ncbi:hypothetical protein CJF31_00007237 [Rutstroemia sp. NJR-2017a BVV2]|nr:hypothetical protein CJF31_00007237 [Rutstroemia sp. NJR-2017a BVV2]
MDASSNFEAIQRQSYPRHISTSDSPNVHTPHRTYHAPISSFDNDIVHTIPRRITSLPCLQLEMYSETSFCTPARPASANPSRRSVSGMKQLLPLRLSTPQTPTSTSSYSPASCRRTTFGHNAELGGFSDPKSIASRRKIAGPPLAIRPAGYRDTPVYSKTGTPLLDNPYSVDAKNCTRCFEGAACTTSCIIDDYEGFSDSSSGSKYDSDYSKMHDEESEASTPISRRRRNSSFSFKCMGEAYSETSSWFGSPVRQRKNPFSGSLRPIVDRLSEHRSSVDIEEWLSDSTSMCGSDTEENDDFFACATALAPAKAHVVHVNVKQSPPLSITIPTRSSSVPSRLNLSDDSTVRHSKSYTKEQEECISLKQPSTKSIRQSVSTTKVDLAMTSPPASPEPSVASTVTKSTRQPTTSSQTEHKRVPQFSAPTSSPIASAPRSFSDIISTIEDSTTNFPSKMLLADTPCVSTIRSHLSSAKVSPQASKLQSKPKSLKLHIPSTSFSSSTSSLDRLLRTHTHPRPQTICYSPISAGTSIYSPLDIDTPLTPPFSPPNFSSTFQATTTKPNLNPLRSIFPHSSDFLLSSLYAYIMSYTYLTTLPSNSIPSSSSTPSHPPTYASNSRLHRTPSFTRSSFGIPAKAASTLGINIEGLRNGKSAGMGSKGKTAKTTRKEDLEAAVLRCIGKLLEGMEGVKNGGAAAEKKGKKGEKEKEKLEGWMVRSLVEVVRGGEGL